MAETNGSTLIEIREDSKEIMEIAEAAHKYLYAEHNINLEPSKAIPTIAYAFLRQTIEFINEKKAPDTDYSINLMQLLDIGISHRSNEDAEKEGNYTPYARPGQEFKLLVKDDNETETE